MLAVSRFVLRHKLAVVVFWLAVLVAGGIASATVVRALLVPALVAVFGRWNWWLPSWASRLRRIPAPAAASEPAAAPAPAAGRREPGR